MIALFNSEAERSAADYARKAWLLPSLSKLHEIRISNRVWNFPCVHAHPPNIEFDIWEQGPVVRRWVKFNPGLGETLNIIISSGNITGLVKLLLKNTPRKSNYVNPKWQPKSIFKARANERNMLCQHVGHNMLRSFVHHVGLCCMMLAYVASSLKPVKLFARHMPTFLLFSWPMNQVVAFPHEVIVFCN